MCLEYNSLEEHLTQNTLHCSYLYVSYIIPYSTSYSHLNHLLSQWDAHQHVCWNIM